MIDIEKLKAGEWVSGKAQPWLRRTGRGSFRAVGRRATAGLRRTSTPTTSSHASAAFPARAASGAMVQGYVVDFMADIFGVDWLGNGSFNLKFVAPVQIRGQRCSKGSLYRHKG